jgi:hypothetical protein
MLQKNVNVTNAIPMVEATELDGLDILQELTSVEAIVKPVLDVDGYHTVVFGGIEFELIDKTKIIMTIKYSKDGMEYTETVKAQPKTKEKLDAVKAVIGRIMSDIGEQFNIVGVKFTFKDLNKHVGENITIKIYRKPFEAAVQRTDGSVETVTRLGRAWGFWKQPVAVEVPKF